MSVELLYNRESTHTKRLMLVLRDNTNPNNTSIQILSLDEAKEILTRLQEMVDEWDKDLQPED